MNNKKLGSFGEQIVAKMVIDKGYALMETNFRCKYGEIDIIARDGQTIVFIEVKTRRSFRYGAPEEAVNYSKQKKLRLLAQYYLSNTFSLEVKCRFDVYSVVLDKNNGLKDVRVLENCF